jgi:hypothetical protein
MEGCIRTWQIIADRNERRAAFYKKLLKEVYDFGYAYAKYKEYKFMYKKMIERRNRALRMIEELRLKS